MAQVTIGMIIYQGSLSIRTHCTVMESERIKVYSLLKTSRQFQESTAAQKSPRTVAHQIDYQIQGKQMVELEHSLVVHMQWLYPRITKLSL